MCQEGPPGTIESMFDAHVLKVLISSPGDTADEVRAVKDALHGWNGSRAEGARAILLPRHWKSDAVPRLSPTGGQGVINSQLVDDADIVIALFDARLGQATDAAVSGTAEEIQRAADAGKHVHVYFSDEPIDRKKADFGELARLQEFQTELQAKGLLGEYSDLNDLAYKVRDAVEQDVAELGLGDVSVQSKRGEHAIPRFRVERTREQSGVDRKGAPKFRTRSKLVLENKSQTVPAYDLTFDLGPLRGSMFRENDAPFTLLPLADVQWELMLDMGSPTQVDIPIKWLEDGKAQEVTQTLTVS